METARLPFFVDILKARLSHSLEVLDLRVAGTILAANGYASVNGRALGF